MEGKRMTITYNTLINKNTKTKLNITNAKDFYEYEFKQYKRLYLEYMNELSQKKHDEYTQKYLKGFTQYCKYFARYYARKIAMTQKENTKEQINTLRR